MWVWVLRRGGCGVWRGVGVPRGVRGPPGRTPGVKEGCHSK